MLRRPSEQQCYEIIKWTVGYLQDYGMHEHNMFRESKSQHDIRSLKDQICEGRSRRQLGDLDCHVVGGVLVSALKDLPNALLYEIQDKLMETADLADGTDECLDRIAAYISRLPPIKIEVVRILFTYLHELAVSSFNDANMVHLMIIFAPLFCKPDQTAHMSIRHVDMLRQLRPVLQVTLDNNKYIMSHIVTNPPPAVAVAKGSVHNSRMAKGDSDQKMNKYEIGLSINTAAGAKSISHDSVTPFLSEITKNTHLNSPIPRLDMTMKDNETDSLLRMHSGASMDVDSDTPPSDQNVYPFSSTSSSGFFGSNSGHNINTHSWEWKLLDSLVLSRVETLVHKCDLVTYWDSNRNKGNTEDMSPRSLQGGSQEGIMNSTESQIDVGSAMEQDDEEQDMNNAVQNIHGRLVDRRALIAECKQLRQSIQQFEEHWIMEFKRSPKPHERGSMQQSYSRYKEIKKAIRDDAAIDIQRIIRGHFRRQDRSSIAVPMEMDQQQEYIKQAQLSHLQKRPVSADGYHSSSSSHGKPLSLSSGSTNLSATIPVNRSKSDDGGVTRISGSCDDSAKVMFEADSKSHHTKSSGVKQPQQNTWLSQEQSNISSDSSTSKTSGGSNGSKQSYRSDSGKYDDDVNALCDRYKDALESKKSLKKLLKKFDDDFVLKKGRAPKKADKEVMRPQYQKYHEVRGDLEKIKADIVKKLGYFPKELEESRPTNGEDSTTGGDNKSGGHHDSSESSIVMDQSIGGSNRIGSGTGVSEQVEEVDGGEDDDDHISGTSISSSQSRGGNEGSKAATPSPTLSGLEELNQEKKHLHMYLKSFEKEFNRANGRHVMHPEDILPVAKEYQRYKELKKILKDFRTSAS